MSSLHDVSDTDSDVTVDLSPDGLEDPTNISHTASTAPGSESKDTKQQKLKSAKSPSLISPKKASVLLKSVTTHDISESDTDSGSDCQVMEKSQTPKCSTSKRRSNEGCIQTERGKSKKRKHDSEADTQDADASQSSAKLGHRDSDTRPMCRYGAKCYRKNPSHLMEFHHPGEPKCGSSSDPTTSLKRRRTEENLPSTSTGAGPAKKYPPKYGASILADAHPLNFLLTKVTGIAEKHNAFHAIHIKNILSSKMGQLQKSAQFNYKIDIPWLVAQYGVEVRTKPLLIIHGATRGEKAELDMEASAFDHVQLGQARLDMMYGTHHTKMMLLLYTEGLRVVIHTANLIDRDWFQKTQGVWISPLFPKMSSQKANVGDSVTNFKRDLLEYLSAYKMRALEDWIKLVGQHDLSSASVHLIASVPGRHTADKKGAFGHLKLRKVLEKHGPDGSLVTKWPVIGQFSSVGSLGGNQDLWLCKEWLETMATVAKSSKLTLKTGSPKLKLIFPSKENVRQSLEGYAAGGAIPYSINVAKKQPYLHSFFHQWKSDIRGRSVASPHIKTYLRPSPDYTQLAWFLVTSANLSKAAWGALEKNASQLMIRSYEIGVLFLPQNFSNKDTFQALQMSNKDQKSVEGKLVFPLPYDLPPTPYTDKDRPWLWDIPYLDKPDTHGTKWCPS